MRALPWVAVAAVLAGAAPAWAQGGLPHQSATGGETPAPGANGAANSINPTGNNDLPSPPAVVPPSPVPPITPGIGVDEARQKLAGTGLGDVGGLYLDAWGVWRGVATRDGRPVMAWVDAKGDVGSAPLEPGPDQERGR